MGIKDFFMRKMLESKMKNVPKEEQERVIAMLEKNPELFQKIAKEIEAEMKKGKDQMSASIMVMARYKNELQKLNQR